MTRAVRTLARRALLCCALVAPGAAGAQVVSAAAGGAAGGAAAPQATQDAAYSPQVERAARAIFADVLSPYCPGLSLTACPSQGAFILKDSIRKELAAGRTSEQVWAGLEARFGPSIYAKPKARGVGLLAWIGPYVAIALAGLLLTWWLRRGASRERAPAVLVTDDPTLRDDQRAALDAALRSDR